MWRLGFSALPPRPTTAAVLQGIDLWSQRAELAAIHEELPWTDLLAGMSPDDILDRDKVQLVAYMRAKGLQLYFMADLTDGLSRGEEAPQLRALGRSITEPAVQQVYRNYVLAVERKLHPEIIGLAAETNLIRAAAPSAVYAAVVTATNGAAADLGAAGSAATLMFSVQVETAWGLLGGNGNYVGVEQDFTDFPFVQMLDSVAARGLIQLMFADIELASFPPPFPANLPLFINIGLTDSDFNPKPALAAWDALYGRHLLP